MALLRKLEVKGGRFIVPFKAVQKGKKNKNKSKEINKSPIKKLDKKKM